MRCSCVGCRADASAGQPPHRVLGCAGGCCCWQTPIARGPVCIYLRLMTRPRLAAWRGSQSQHPKTGVTQQHRPRLLRRAACMLAGPHGCHITHLLDGCLLLNLLLRLICGLLQLAGFCPHGAVAALPTSTQPLQAPAPSPTHNLSGRTACDYVGRAIRSGRGTARSQHRWFDARQTLPRGQ